MSLHIHKSTRLKWASETEQFFFIVQEEGRVVDTSGPQMTGDFHVLESLPEMYHMKQKTRFLP
jgi:hypothetical protein